MLRQLRYNHITCKKSISPALEDRDRCSTVAVFGAPRPHDGAPGVRRRSVTAPSASPPMCLEDGAPDPLAVEDNPPSSSSSCSASISDSDPPVAFGSKMVAKTNHEYYDLGEFGRLRLDKYHPRFASPYARWILVCPNCDKVMQVIFFVNGVSWPVS